MEGAGAGVRRSHIDPDVLGGDPPVEAFGDGSRQESPGPRRFVDIWVTSFGQAVAASTVGEMILDRVAIDAEAFRAGTGWEIKPEGACKGDVCVPLPGGFEVTRVAERLGMALVHDEENRLWALGPESIGGRALVDAKAPDLVLAAIDGNEFDLSSLRGQKVVLVAWAPY